MYYWGKLYGKGIKQGEDYINLKKTISILITDFELDNIKEIEKFHTEWKIREKKYQKIVLTDIFELHIIELPKLEKAFIRGKIEKENRKLATWCKFLINPDNMEEKEMQENEDIKKAKEELEKMRMDEYEERIAELRMKAIMDEKSGRNYEYNRGKREGIEKGMEKGIEKGMEKGIEKGKKEEKVKIAKELLKINMKIEEIMKITGLTKEEIEIL